MTSYQVRSSATASRIALSISLTSRSFALQCGNRLLSDATSRSYFLELAHNDPHLTALKLNCAQKGGRRVHCPSPAMPVVFQGWIFPAPSRNPSACQATG